jgi:hypothetical protein
LMTERGHIEEGIGSGIRPSPAHGDSEARRERATRTNFYFSIFY